MPKKDDKYTVVTVEGYGQFPIDMLRYDRATPESEVDSGRIEETDKNRRVRVRMPGWGKPTTARWESFLWAVIDVEYRTHH